MYPEIEAAMLLGIDVKFESYMKDQFRIQVSGGTSERSEGARKTTIKTVTHEAIVPMNTSPGEIGKFIEAACVSLVNGLETAELRHITPITFTKA